MEIKKDIEAYTQDFWYDVKEGYIKPEAILVNQGDINAVKAAIAILKEFEDSCDEQIEGFIQ